MFVSLHRPNNVDGSFPLQPKTKSEPRPLMHGDEVKMGETVLSFHIHSGTDTCDGCEPGQVMAHLSKHKREEAPGGKKTRLRSNKDGLPELNLSRLFPKGPGLAKEDKESLRQKELKQMKAKYGLQVREQPASPEAFLLFVCTRLTGIC